MQHGLCERKVLNVDKNRERCHISDLDQSKLRRVAFCVDVEIARGPRYVDDAEDDKKKETKEKLRRMTERGEGQALKRPEQARKEKEEDGVVKATEEQLPKEPAKEAQQATTEVKDDAPTAGHDTTKTGMKATAH